MSNASHCPKACDFCGALYSKPANVGHAAWNKRRFCSISCRSNGQRTHGEAWSTPEYHVWQAMIQRCTNPSNPRFRNYGARGIVVCDSWRRSFAAFLSDMGRRPSARHSLDRIDNDRSYSPDNCRWATIGVQSRNRRTNRLLTHDGRTLTIAEWATIVDVKQNTIVTRLRSGWNVDRALSESTHTKCRTSRALP